MIEVQLCQDMNFKHSCGCVVTFLGYAFHNQHEYKPCAEHGCEKGKAEGAHVEWLLVRQYWELRDLLKAK